MNSILIISNLPLSTNQEEFRDRFRDYKGFITSRVYSNDKHDSIIAEFEFNNHEAAEFAKKSLHSYSLTNPLLRMHIDYKETSYHNQYPHNDFHYYGNQMMNSTSQINMGQSYQQQQQNQHNQQQQYQQMDYPHNQYSTQANQQYPQNQQYQQQANYPQNIQNPQQPPHQPQQIPQNQYQGNQQQQQNNVYVNQGHHTHPHPQHTPNQQNAHQNSHIVDHQHNSSILTNNQPIYNQPNQHQSQQNIPQQHYQQQHQQPILPSVQPPPPLPQNIPLHQSNVNIQQQNHQQPSTPHSQTRLPPPPQQQYQPQQSHQHTQQVHHVNSNQTNAHSVYQQPQNQSQSSIQHVQIVPPSQPPPPLYPQQIQYGNQNINNNALGNQLINILNQVSQHEINSFNKTQEAINSLYVDGVPSDANEREVSHIFRPFPGFMGVRLIRKRTQGGREFYFCFADFENSLTATIALKTLQGYRFDKNDTQGLKISYANEPHQLKKQESHTTINNQPNLNQSYSQSSINNSQIENNNSINHGYQMSSQNYQNYQMNNNSNMNNNQKSSNISNSSKNNNNNNNNKNNFKSRQKK